jgi:hypothetical protein
MVGLPLGRVLSQRARLGAVAALNARRGLLRAVIQRAPGAVLSAHALSHVWIAAGGRPIPPRALFFEVAAMGGEPDADDAGHLVFRFQDLDCEARALAALR